MVEHHVKILLVEDDEDDYVLTREYLRQADDRYVLLWERDFDRALVRICQDEVDVCLVDFNLGERNGVEFVRQATERNCRAPVILLTGQGDHEVDLAAMNAGAADFLSKAQLTADLLERTIRYAIQQRKSEEQRIRLLAEHAARLQAEAESRAKDRFLATLSHELRTPLTPVLMAVAALEQDAELPEKYRDDVRMVRQNVELEARLIDDLLDLTRVARGKLELHRDAVDVHSLVNDAVRTCCDEEIYKKRLRVRISTAAAEHYVWADSARLQQIVWNLIKNAIKFTAEGGHIELRTSNPDPGQLRIEVIDNGIGIERELLPRIFDAFEQGDRSVTRMFGGLGLGLAICKALVDMHHGRIYALSEGPGHGATFVVELNTIPEPAKPHRAEPAASPPAPRSLSILLVEDHESTSRLMARLLRGFNHEVQTAADVGTARQLAASHNFDLVVSDLGLPDGNGLELMQYLRQQYGLRGIALSGYGMEEDIRQSKAAGFDEHLVKPVNLQQLQAAINRVASSAGNAVLS